MSCASRAHIAVDVRREHIRTTLSTMIEGTIQGAGELKLFTRAWQVAGKPRGAVAIVPGFNAHGGHYQWVADQLVAAGLSTYALDLRGRGKSDGERYYVDKFQDYVDDVAVFVRHVKAHEPGSPVFLLGHSAGGVVACVYALDHQTELAGLICESFAYQVPAPDFVLAVLKGISHIAPHAHVLRLKNEDFSRDPARVEMMNHDPLIAHEVQPTKTVAEMVRADERLKKELARITLPILIVHGTADRAAKPSGSKRFYELAGSRDKTLKLYDGYFHDPLADLGKEIVMAEVVRWIDVRLPK
jgi:alpha-beta hydrolase superfamily lysophospholipase